MASKLQMTPVSTGSTLGQVSARRAAAMGRAVPVPPVGVYTSVLGLAATEVAAAALAQVAGSTGVSAVTAGHSVAAVQGTESASAGSLTT